jgi:2-polyprenyl-3-methyl-5-hydroxy-6-metoxy-1,4-benzoquinol methylase
MDLMQAFYERIYRRAERPSDLPWHHDEPPELLVKAAASNKPGRALDLGCGTGTCSVWLAQQGYLVTGLDFTEGALEFARKRAKENDVDVDFQRADVLEWKARDRFVLILDSGCLHSLPSSARARYRQRLFEWLAPGGDYVLVHFEKLRRFDPELFGPKKRKREDLVTELAPLELQAERTVDVTRGPLPFLGPARLAHLWFRRV